MNKLALIPAAAALAVGLGFAGAANAGHLSDLVNGDAETGLTGWNADAAVDAVMSSGSGQIPAPDVTDGDDYFFSTGEEEVGAGGSAALDQDLFVWGCGVEYLQGTYQVTGLYATGGSDEGKVTATFFNPLDVDIGSMATGTLTTGDGSWAGFNIGTIGVTEVPVNAATMNVEMEGTEGSGVLLIADVGFDNASVALQDCLADFSKISGKIGARRGSHSFEGSVGTPDEGGDMTGEIAINYKDLKENCIFTAETATYFGATLSDSVELVGTMDCEEKNGDTHIDMATTIYMVSAVDSSGSSKDRGAICVAADDGDGHLDINNGAPESTCTDADNAPVDLANGNIWVDGNTVDVF